VKSLSNDTKRSIRKAITLLLDASYTVVLTGAGISTRSGIPDFRSDDGGLWTQVDPMEIASLYAFRTSPEKFYQGIQPLVKTIINAKPNPAHLAITQLQNAGYVHTIITQNIDDLHRKAGSTNIREVHGTINSLTCISCYSKHKLSQELVTQFIANGIMPRCNICNEALKPDVILFGEQLPISIWQKAEKDISKCDLMISAGSSLEMIPVAGLPLKAHNCGAKLIIINNTSTYANEFAEVVIQDDVAKVLPLIAKGVLDD
jgi:NAD-dependent deacetylase